MGCPSKKSEALALSIDSASLADAIADRLFERFDRKYGRAFERPTDAPAKRLLTIEEFSSARGTSKWLTKKEIRLGKIKAVKVGDLTRIPIEELDRYVQDAPIRAPSTGNGQ
jgi:excisionase family DNA binding protein